MRDVRDRLVEEFGYRRAELEGKSDWLCDSIYTTEKLKTYSINLGLEMDRLVLAFNSIRLSGKYTFKHIRHTNTNRTRKKQKLTRFQRRRKRQNKY